MNTYSTAWLAHETDPSDLAARESFAAKVIQYILIVAAVIAGAILVYG